MSDSTILLKILSDKFSHASANSFRERVFSKRGGRFDYATPATLGRLLAETLQIVPSGTANENPAIVMRVLEYLESRSIVAYNKVIQSEDDYKAVSQFFNNFLESASSGEDNYEAVLARCILQAAAANPNTILSEGIKGILLTAATARGYSEHESLQLIEDVIERVGREENPGYTS